MIQPQSTTTSPSATHVKAAFVSDIHLGSRYCQADRFLSFLNAHKIDQLYLVGDFIDGWRLRSTWRWPEVYHRILHRLLEMQADGTQLFYTPGNHDEFLRHYMKDYGFVRIEDEFVHEAIDGRRFLIMHGDKFDEVEQQCQWLSVVGARLYEFLLWTNYSINSVRRMFKMDEWHYSGAVKMKFKGAVNFISDFETKIANHARNRGCESVLCGHIHAPTVSEIDDITYCNTGDWVEHCTAIVEHVDGSWELACYFDDETKQLWASDAAAVEPAQSQEETTAEPVQVEADELEEALLQDLKATCNEIRSDAEKLQRQVRQRSDSNFVRPDQSD